MASARNPCFARIASVKYLAADLIVGRKNGARNIFKATSTLELKTTEA